MGGRGSAGGKRSAGGGNVYTMEQIKAMRTPFMFDKQLFEKLPKKLQDDKVIAIYKEKTMDGVLYSAVIQWEDGFDRSISEYGLKDFKGYLDEVLHVDRNTEY